MPNVAPQRVYFDAQEDLVELPDLIANQRESFYWFVDQGLEDLFEEVNPIKDYTGEKLSLTFKDYQFSEPEMTSWEAKRSNASYESSLTTTVELVNKQTGEVVEQEIYLGDYPWMTPSGTFIINGTERAVVSQLIRSPGVFFNAEVGEDRKLYGAKIIPGRGAWFEFTTKSDNSLNVKIDRKRKLPVTTLLRALGFSTDEQLREIFDGVEAEGAEEYLEATLENDETTDASEALLAVYKRMRPGDLATVENAKELIDDTFFNFKRFDFSKVGRYKINQRLGLGVENTKENRILRPEDIKAVVQEIVRLNLTQEPEDEIDSFANRRLKMVGELMQRYFRIGLLRMERNAKDRMSVYDLEEITPKQLMNSRPIVASVREFYASSQLSQFMDQVNPLAELTHKRRLNAMGPGGLSRERAGFEVRDVHRTHYGRACVVETPEGSNIGLVLSMANFARVNEYGFIETPYRKVINEVAPEDAQGHIVRRNITNDGKTIVESGKKLTKTDVKKLKKADLEMVPVKAQVTTEVEYLDTADEEQAIIAQAATEFDDDGYFVKERAAVRKAGVAGEEDVDNITHMDVSTKQTLGVSASLIPFVEKDAVTRSLTGANQQRQAVPLIRPQAPLVGTGMESFVAENTGQIVTAEESGKVKKATAEEVVVDYDDEGEKSYSLHTYERSTRGTAITQRVRVENGQKVDQGDLIADGMSTDGGELALGANLLVAFMPWGGYNFEDAIIVSNRLVEDDTLSSVHIEDYSIDVRETKLGRELITRDIPNVSEETLRDLNEDGIVRIGADVRPGDVLVGKITPKGEQELSSEERLLRAIFGEKAKDVRDSSLRMPNGKHGTVVDVRVFSREEGHDLKAGILKQVQIHVAQKRKVAVGDKLGGRHGNKGVIARILPKEDMPFREDGTPVDIILNPLGVAHRMNIGQLWETHLGWAAKALGYKVASPPFDGVSTEKIKEELAKAGLPEDSKTQLIDGRTGEPFEERTTIGFIYMNKLEHMIEDKIHARATGPYTMVTQQPLGGKAQNGGQRFGEMEVWALEAYGVAYTLQEMLTIKSDDVIGRSKAYESIVKGENIRGPRLPESFNVLVKELQSLSLEVDLLDREDHQTDAEDVLSKEYEHEGLAADEDEDEAETANQNQAEEEE